MAGLRVRFACRCGDYVISALRDSDGPDVEDYIRVVNTVTSEEKMTPVDFGNLFRDFCEAVGEYEALTGCKSVGV